MKKSHFNLLKLASKFGNKYALDAGPESPMKDEVQSTIQTAIAHAAGNKSSGIMPFLQMLKQDQAALNINITRENNNIIASNISMTPSNVEFKYAALSAQIQKYLQNNLELFPTIRNGETINYNLTITLTFDGTV